MNAAHALVLGGSYTGCLVALALSECFDRVTIVEKDDFPDGPTPRRGVPQEAHVHLLLSRGRSMLSRLQPGLVDELEAAGALEIDQGHGVRCHRGGTWRDRYKVNVSAHYFSRALLDSLLRRRVRACPRIEVLEKTCVTGARWVSAYRHEAQVSLKRPGTVEAWIHPNLVVDATGRRSMSHRMLPALGVSNAPVEHIPRQLRYLSQSFRARMDRGGPQRKEVLLQLPGPGMPDRMAVLSPIEGDQWIATTCDWSSEGFSVRFGNLPEIAATLIVPAISDALSSCAATTEVSYFRINGSTRRAFHATDMPRNWLVLGDAMAALNPIYSQGVSVVAMEVARLRMAIPDWLRGSVRTVTLQKRLFEETTPAWQLVSLLDGSAGDAPTGALAAIREWYFEAFEQLACEDRMALRTSIAVTHFLANPASKLRPRFMARILLNALLNRFPYGVHTP